MTDVAVVDLSEIRAADAERLGPKMARLGQLAADGWQVPDGYAVTAAALDGWLPAAARGELARLFTGPAPGHDELTRLAEQARSLVESQPLPSWLEEAVAAAHARLASRTGRGAGLRVAVRSSAVSEDGQAASFAGQYETYLGVSGVADVLLHVRRCWASGFSAHALAYRRRFGGASPVRVHDLAVGVLELVDARSAGVAFTLDPVTGDRGVCVVEGNWGFGESVVSGQVTPDYWTVDRASGRVLTARTGAKLAWAALSPDSGRVVLSPLPADLAGQACLSEEEVRYICAQAARIEDAAGGVPQDVEWAIARDLPFPGSVFFLQHRPETTWTAGEVAGPPGAAGEPAFDPVKYALRHVFKVPGT
ncbi:MAG: PEP/pyruvate-binding domain-containing protein [Trebonia sp.]